MELFKDLVKSILQTGTNFSEEEDFEKIYNTFIVNRALSNHYDCILIVNEMNMRPSLPKKIAYLFLLNTIRKVKRPFREWFKKEQIQDLDIIREYYKISYQKSKEYLKLLTPKQIEEMKEHLEKGGSGK